MIEIKSKIINLKFDKNTKELFLNNNKLKADERKVRDMKPVLMCEEIQENLLDKTLYYMFRDVKREEDEKKLGNIRFDITAIIPGKICGEYIKTFGHVHSYPENSSLSYPEVYQVLNGQALFVLQKYNDSLMVEEVILVEGLKGDIVIIPPNYGHVTVNIGEDMLVMSNLISRNCKSDYKRYEERRGAAVYAVSEEVEGVPEIFINGAKIIRNKNYKEEFKITYYENLKEHNSRFLKRDFPSGENLYDLLVLDFFDFSFLEKPSLMIAK